MGTETSHAALRLERGRLPGKILQIIFGRKFKEGERMNWGFLAMFLLGTMAGILLVCLVAVLSDERGKR